MHKCTHTAHVYPVIGHRTLFCDCICTLLSLHDWSFLSPNLTNHRLRLVHVWSRPYGLYVTYNKQTWLRKPDMFFLTCFRPACTLPCLEGLDIYWHRKFWLWIWPDVPLQILPGETKPGGAEMRQNLIKYTWVLVLTSKFYKPNNLIYCNYSNNRHASMEKFLQD